MTIEPEAPNEATRDWNGQRQADWAQPIHVVTCGQLRAIAVTIEAQEEKIGELSGQNETLRDALLAAEAADEQKANCEECEPEMAPEGCPACFPSADLARCKRHAALGMKEDPVYAEGKP
jgi:hypothetical protein